MVHRTGLEAVAKRKFSVLTGSESNFFGRSFLVT
jgi:hypothetical protein